MREDVLDGLYSAETAHLFFGVVFAGAKLELDRVATEEARRRLAACREPLSLSLPTRPSASGWLERTMQPGDEQVDVPPGRGL